ncbi:MAG: hypothetical protein AAFU57_13570 [Bacteroidota bacterium]
MQESKRLDFLKSYLKLFGVEKIKVINETPDLIRGIAIYDENDPDELQEFVWHKPAKEVPSAEINILVEKITNEKWHEGDKILTKIQNMNFKEFDSTKRDELLDELFDVEIRMVDDGKETDSFWVHF